MRELSIDVLTDEAVKLLRMEIDGLYVTLGGQLLGQNLPSRMAGIVSYLSAVRSASEAKSFYEALPSTPSLTEWSKGLAVIYEELRQDGIRYFSQIKQDLQNALCNDEIIRLSHSVTRSTMQMVVMIIAGVLRIPRELDPICVTIAAIIIKQGLEGFCRNLEAQPKELSLRK